MQIRHYRVVSGDPPLPVMICVTDSGDAIIQIGRSRPLQAVPIDPAAYHKAMETDTWPDGRSSRETK